MVCNFFNLRKGLYTKTASQNEAVLKLVFIQYLTTFSQGGVSLNQLSIIFLLKF